MENEIIKGYKALKKDMSSRYGYMKYEIGKQYRLDGKLSFGKNGYHFCENMIDISGFYNLDNSRVFEIEASGNILNGENKSCTNSIRLIRELSEDEISTIINENYNNEDIYVRESIAKSKYASSKTLEILSKDKALYVRVAVAENANIDTKLLEKLSHSIHWYIRRSVSRNSSITTELLTRLANDLSSSVRYEVAENSKTDAKILEKLSGDDDWEVRYAVAENPNTSVKVLEKLSEDENDDVRYAANMSLDEKNQVELAEKN